MIYSAGRTKLWVAVKDEGARGTVSSGSSKSSI